MSHYFTKANRSSPWLLIALGAVVVLFNGSINAVKGQRFCGAKLTDALTTYCEIFPTLAPSIKRSQGQTIEGTNYREILFPKVPFVGERGMVGMINSKPNWMRAIFAAKGGITAAMGDDFTDLMVPDRFQMEKRGVVNDCCYRVCSLEYLLSNYCSLFTRTNAN
ncbi:uncharacterized protein LOC135703103 [Ochlerotatus camptorhynchus]|uniref:uncharacterized protein LOC135703103 n=1 Tax=Ochlerotatus camptorhynchus TaxID=644619 RepID=UPI0031D1354E